MCIRDSLFVTCFGIGSFRFAPGTITSLITTIFLYSLFHIVHLSSSIILLILFLVFIYSFYAVAEYIKYNENKDPKEIVVDEFIGQSIPIYLYEISHGTQKDPAEALLFYLYIFILFRFFDIKKPFPVYYFDKKFKLLGNSSTSGLKSFTSCSSSTSLEKNLTSSTAFKFSKKNFLSS